ncbi:hypothetical protein SeMB42_g06673 [Synchytrium endobioticum]|nr:hypothetical protein SeMB42_g06673 [Synchytrium endobioticum]
MPRVSPLGKQHGQSCREVDSKSARSAIYNVIHKAQWSYCETLKGSSDCVNALALAPERDILLSGGDDKRVLIWSTASSPESTSPLGAFTGHNGIIFCVQAQQGTIYSCGNDGLLLKYSMERAASTSSTQQPSRNSETNADDVILAADAGILKLSIHPENHHLVLTAAQDGLVKLFDFRSSSREQGSLPKDNKLTEHNHVEFNPGHPVLFVTTDLSNELKLYDIRMFGASDCKPVLKMKSPKNDVSAAVFSPNGRYAVSQCHNHVPVIFDIHSYDSIDSATNSLAPLCHLTVPETEHSAYLSSITIKTPSFQYIGDELVVCCGSEDFNVYGWRDLQVKLYSLSTASPMPPANDSLEIVNDFILPGARSIVNNVLIHPHQPRIYTSGVESVIRCYSPFSMSQYETPPTLITRKPTPYPDLLEYLERLPSELDDTVDGKAIFFFDRLLGRESFRRRFTDMLDLSPDGMENENMSDDDELEQNIESRES